jgi:hypothetical protein
MGMVMLLLCRLGDFLVDAGVLAGCHMLCWCAQGGDVIPEPWIDIVGSVSPVSQREVDLARHVSYELRTTASGKGERCTGGWKQQHVHDFRRLRVPLIP